MSDQIRDVPGDAQLKELWKDMGDGTFARRVVADVSVSTVGLQVIAEGEVTVVTAGTPVAVPANANAKAVCVFNNNEDGTICAAGLAASVDALSTPRIGRILYAGDGTKFDVASNSNEVYVDSTVSAKKFTYQILG